MPVSILVMVIICFGGGCPLGLDLFIVHPYTECKQFACGMGGGYGSKRSGPPANEAAPERRALLWLWLSALTRASGSRQVQANQSCL